MLRHGALVIVALDACGAPPPRPADPPPAIAVAGAATGGPSAIQEVEPVVLAGPPEIACTFVAKDYSLSLALDGEGPRFGAVVSANGTLGVAKGPATAGAFLEHADGGLHLRGYVQTDQLELYVTRPALFGGWLVPRETTKLRWTEGQKGGLELRLDEDFRDVRATTVTFHEKPRAVVPCADIALVSPNDTLDTAAFVLRGRKGREQYVRPGEPIPIARKPGDPPVAEIRFSYADTAEVAVIERSGAYALVVVDAWGPATLYGWIPDAVFVPPPGRLASGHHTRAPTLRQGETVLKTTKRVTCDAPVRILAEVAGRRAWVGEIDARTPIVVVVDDRTDRFLNLELEGAYAHDGARLAVERSAIDVCQPVTPRR